MDVDDAHTSTTTEDMSSYSHVAGSSGEHITYSTETDPNPNYMEASSTFDHVSAPNDADTRADETHAASAEDQDSHQENQQKRLANAREALQQPDAVLESDVFANIKTIFESGGSPQEIIRSLAGSYHGFPQMCNLVSFWLRRLGVAESEIVSSVEGHIRDEIKKNFDPHKADRIFEMGSVRFFLLLAAVA